jgi:alpha-N-acetylglucosamine transferase
MKILSYKEYLAMSKDKINETLAPVRAMKARKQAELKVAEMDERIASQEARIQEYCTQQNLNFEAILDSLDELALMERRKGQLVKIIDSMFPAEVEAKETK